MDAMKKINWKQPKYMIPIIIYFPLLFVGYFVIDLFHTEKAETPNGLTTTDYLNFRDYSKGRKTLFKVYGNRHLSV